MAEKIFAGGITNTVLHLETDGTIHVEDQVDAEPILDLNAVERNERFSGESPEGLVHSYARVPYPTLMQWANEAGCTIFAPEFSVVMEKKLREPDHSKFLTSPTRCDTRIRIKGRR